eukprot:scaffold5035_cov88-Skeletonema_dohrnii-CCMP3373.AAC.1
MHRSNERLFGRDITNTLQSRTPGIFECITRGRVGHRTAEHPRGELANKHDLGLASSLKSDPKANGVIESLGELASRLRLQLQVPNIAEETLASFYTFKNDVPSTPPSRKIVIRDVMTKSLFDSICLDRGHGPFLFNDCSVIAPRDLQTIVGPGNKNELARQNTKLFELLISDLGKQNLVAVGSIDKHDRIVFFMPISGCVAAMYTSRVSVQTVAACCDKLQAEKLRLEEERLRKLQAEKLRLEEERLRKLQAEKLRLEEERMRKLQAEKLRLEEERMRRLQAEKLRLEEERMRKLMCRDAMSKMLDQITMTATAEPKSIAFEDAASLQLCGVAASTPIPDSSSSVFASASVSTSRRGGLGPASSDQFDIATSNKVLTQRFKYDPFQVQRREQLSSDEQTRRLNLCNLTLEDVESIKGKLRIELAAATWAQRLPQTANLLNGVIDAMFLMDKLNGCLMHFPTQQSLGHVTMVGGGNCLAGHDLLKCLSMKLMTKIDGFVDQSEQRSSLIVGRDIENIIAFEREVCLTPNCSFQRCKPYTPAEVQDIVDAINFYLRLGNSLHADMFFWSMGGTTTNARSIMELIDASMYPNNTVHGDPTYHIQFLGKPLPNSIHSEDNRLKMLSQFTSLSETFDAHVKSTTGEKPARSFLEFMLDSPDIPALARDNYRKEYEQWFDMEVGYEMTQLNKFLPGYCMRAEGDSLVFADNHDYRVQL